MEKDIKKDINRKKSQDASGYEVGEDATEYGEFISTYFAWIPLAKQKEKAEELEQMTKNYTKEE